MRELKFRGKRIDTGEWIYGSYTHVHDPDGNPSIIETGQNLFIVVDAETVGQYTGVKDRGGAEIYEGDILYSCSEWMTASTGRPTGKMSEHTRAVRWLPDRCCFSDDGILSMSASTSAEYIKVIGNVHDNPEIVLGRRTVEDDRPPNVRFGDGD